MITIYETLTDSPRKQASRLEGRTTSYNLPTKSFSSTLVYFTRFEKGISKTFLYNYILPYSSYTTKYTLIFSSVLTCFHRLSPPFSQKSSDKKGREGGGEGEKKSESNNNERMDEMTFHVHLGSRKLGE